MNTAGHLSARIVEIKRFWHLARGIPDLYKAESKQAPTGKSFPPGGRFF